MNTQSRDASSNDESSRRDEVLKMLRESPEPRTIVDLAEELGVHPNTVRFHLETLTAMGRVERIVGATGGLGRPPVKYLATAGMNPEGPTNYRFLATVLTSQFAYTSQDPADDARRLGHDWSQALVPPTRPSAKSTQKPATPRGTAVRQVVSVLADLGFAPEPVGPRSAQIRLRHCPFLDLVPENSEVICSLHLGLMQGAFAALNGPVTVDRLDPFVEPDLCVARLAPVGAPGTRKPRRTASK